MKKLILLLGAPLLLSACAKPADKAPASSASASEAAPDVGKLPAGTYRSDPAHTSLTFEVDHLGFSRYTARFAKIGARMAFDPAHPEAAQLTALIDPQSLQLNAPPAGFHDALMGKDWFGAAQFPDIRFVSTQVAAIFAAAILCMVPTVNFSGLLYPTATLEGPARFFGRMFPASWFQTVTLGVFDKGLGFADFLPQIAALGGFGLGFLGLARLLVRKQER